jgi:hypothetical protein
MVKQTRKVGLTRNAVIARINRKLAGSNERLKIARDNERMRREVGFYYVVGEEGVTHRDVDIVALAQKLNCLKPWEALLDD